MVVRGLARHGLWTCTNIWRYTNNVKKNMGSRVAVLNAQLAAGKAFGSDDLSESDWHFESQVKRR